MFNLVNFCISISSSANENFLSDVFGDGRGPGGDVGGVQLDGLLANGTSADLVS